MQEVKNFENIVVPGPRTIKKPKYHYMVVGGLLVQLRGVPGGGQLPPPIFWDFGSKACPGAPWWSKSI